MPNFSYKVINYLNVILNFINSLLNNLYVLKKDSYSFIKLSFKVNRDLADSSILEILVKNLKYNKNT